MCNHDWAALEQMTKSIQVAKARQESRAIVDFVQYFAPSDKVTKQLERVGIGIAKTEYINPSGIKCVKLTMGW